MTQLTRALVRPIPNSYDGATAEHPTAIDVELARRQHGLYVEALSTLVDEIVWAPALDDAPDSVFVEDQIVVASGHGLVTRSGHPQRRVERQSVADSLTPWLMLHWMEGPATLDGGDVLRVGRHFFVGQSARTNVLGIQTLTKTFGPLGYTVHAVPVSADLHLKCACSTLRDDLVLVVDTRISPELFKGVADVISVPEEEAYGANLLARQGHALMAAGHPVTQAVVEASGYTVTPLDLTEIRKGDGALTCMSVWF